MELTIANVGGGGEVAQCLSDRYPVVDDCHAQAYGFSRVLETSRWKSEGRIEINGNIYNSK